MTSLHGQSMIDTNIGIYLLLNYRLPVNGIYSLQYYASMPHYSTKRIISNEKAAGNGTAAWHSGSIRAPVALKAY
jgi:hypothetical protein